MEKIWKQIEKWLDQHLPELLSDLQPAAPDKLIAETEKKVGVTFTDDFGQSYRIHNGQLGAVPLLGDWALLSLEQIAQEWSLMADLLKNQSFEGAEAQATGAVKADWWNEKWIPVFSNGAGDLYCADYDPPSGGEKGQIVVYWHVSEEREVIAKSFEALLQSFADDLEAGRYQVVDGMLEKA